MVSPIAGSTTSRNFAGMRRPEKDASPRRSRQRLSQAEPRDRAVRIEQVTVAPVHGANLRDDRVVVKRRTDDVASQRVEAFAVHRTHPLEVARRSDVHRVGDRLTDARGLYSPVLRYWGTTSFALVAATKRSTDSPIRFAISPAVRLPKLPLGTDTTISAGAALTRRNDSRGRNNRKPAVAAVRG